MKNVEDIYPPSPLQESLLYHALSAPGSSVGFEQKISTLRGELDLPAFERTWQKVIDRHPILRTAFVTEGVEKPLQVVRRKATLPVRFEDLRGQPGKRERIGVFMREDRERGFDLKQAPLMRVALFRTADTFYQFVWSYHHLVLDAWCRNLLLREVFTLYDAYRRGSELEMPRSRPFRDYIAWLSRQDPAEARAFWERELGGMRAPTRLGLAREPGNGTPGTEAQGERHAPLGEEAAAALAAFGRCHRVTLNTMVQGAWAILLSRYSGATDIVYGTTVSGRPADLPGVDSILGMFINNLPVRLRVPPDAPLAPWLGIVQAHLAELRRFEHSTPAQIQEASDFGGGQRLFESLVVFQNYPSELPSDAKEVSEGSEAPADSGRGLRVSFYSGKLETSFPVTLVASPGRKLGLRLHFQRHHLDDISADRILGHLKTLLEGFAGAAEIPLSDLPMLSEAERHQLLVELPVERSAPLQGQTGRRLPEAADPAWERLLRSPATGGGPVGLVIEPRAETVAALLGILAAGRACLPLDPPQAGEDLPGWLAKAGADAVIGWPEDRPLEGFAGVHLGWDAARAADPPESDEEDHEPGPDSVALILPLPRAGGCRLVTMTRRELGVLLDAATRWVEGRAGSRFVAAPAPAWRQAWQILLPHAVGSRLHGWTGSDLGRALSESAAEVLLADLPACCDLVRSGWRGQGLRILAWGPPAAAALRNSLHAAGAELRTLLACADAGFEVLLGEDAAESTGPAEYVGVASEPPPAGVMAELRLGRSRTGWRVRQRQDGRFQTLGRWDGELLLSGRLVIPGEIEAALLRHPGLLDAAVAPVRTGGGRTALAAWVVPLPGRAPDLRALQQHLRRILADPALPSSFRIVDRIPRDADGQVDLGALPQPSEEIAGSAELVPPRTPLELRLVQLWEELFGFGPIGVRESFFELGGHSMMAVRLLAELRSRFGRDLPLSILLRSATIERLAQALSERREPGPRSPLVEIQAGGRSAPLFCVHPGGGNVLCYVDLAYHLGPDRPVLAFQSPGLGEGEQALDSVERMAEVYLDELRERHPSGPYRLLGWSFGGLVAYEMARRLAKAGESVPLVAILDTGVLARDSWQDDADLLSRFLGDALPVAADDLRDHGDLDEQLRYAIARAEEKGLLPVGFDPARARRLFEVRRSNKDAARRYEPGPYPGRLALVLSSDSHRELVEVRGLEPTLGWGRLAQGGVDIIPVPGRHDDMVRRPHVAVLAARLKPLLEVA